MKALVIGFGSIGARHARILQELGCEVALVSRREPEGWRVYPCITEGMRNFGPGYVVVANETSAHHQTVIALAAERFTGKLLIEKPLFDRPVEGAPAFDRAFVAYNLRFHPLLQRVRELLEGETLISVQAYVGQYLPTWRPDRDYREGYSASSEAGGGVLRDLSHELDYLNWFLGGWEKLTALGGRYSDLEITSDDVFAVMMSTSRCPVVTAQMNYLDRTIRREVIVNTAARTIGIDFIAGTLQVDGELEKIEADRDVTYREMHRALLDGRHRDLCTMEEGMDVLRMIAAAEESAVSARWIWK